MPCPYLDRGFCEVECAPCPGKRHYENCDTYSAERKRLRAVVAGCPHATRRVHRLRVWKSALGHWAWCHPPVGEPRICYGWPQDCPTYWQSLYEALRDRVGTHDLAKCGNCGRLFLPKRTD